MNAKVGFNEVQAYAKTHNVDFKTAAQKLGLSAQEAAELEKLGGDPGAPVDGFQKKPAHSYTLKSGRKVNVYKDASGKQTFEYLAADGTKLKESYFLKQEGLTGSHFAVNSDGQLVSVKDAPKGDKKDEEKGFWDNAKEFAKNNAGALLAGTAVVVGGALCLTGVAAPVGAGLLAIGAVAGLSSCTTDDEPVLPENINNNNNVNISISLADQRELIAAFEKGIDELLAKMDELGYKVDEYGDKIIDLLVQNNTYLKGISDELENQGKQQEEIIRILTNINSTVDTISSLVEATNENIIINGESVKTQLEAILNAIKNGNVNSMDQVDKYMEQLKAILQTIIEQQGDQIEISTDSNMTLDEILEKINNMEGTTSEKLAAMLEILKSIESIGVEISDKLDVVIGKFDEVFKGQQDVLDALARIEAYVQQNGDKTDVTNNLLNKLYALMESGVNKEDLEAAIAAILKSITENSDKIGDKIDTTNTLIEKIGKQSAEFQAKVLELLAKVGTEYSEVLNKILNATINNGNQLELVNQMLAKIDNRDEKFQQQVLDLLNKAGVDDAAMLKELQMINQMLAKMDDCDEKFQIAALEILNNLDAKEIPDYTEILNKILDSANNNGTKLDAIGQLLAKIQNQDEKFQKNVLNILNNLQPGEVADYTEILNKILEATQNNGAKLEALGQLLSKIQNQDAEFQKNILNAINQLGVDITSKLNVILNAINNVSGGDSSNLEALLNKVLEKMDSNTAAIIDAISNIKPGEGGNVDLSSLEKMLSELLQLTSKNNSLLESIDGKMDVINLTIERAKEEIIAHLGNGGGNVDVSAILAKLDEFMELSNANSEAILKKMDTIINLINNIKTYDDSALMAKLDDILAAIKDHNITVDITGKVTCECNCGGNHEGILGDLEDVLG